MLEQQELLEKKLISQNLVLKIMEKLSKIALVTGSTAGIGLEIAKCMASGGYSVILHGSRSQLEANDIVQNIASKYGVKADYVQADLSKIADVQKLCTDTGKLYPNGIDVLVNNAGFQHISPLEDFPVEKWDAMLAVMLSAPFHLIKHILPSMKQKKWGRIVNISSVCGFRGFPNKTPYLACKHGLNGLTKGVAIENASHGITCNAICPGWVETKIFEAQVQTYAENVNLPYEEAKQKFISERHPTGKAVTVKEIAETVMYLCSPAADNVTGTLITMDGGLTI